MYVSSKTMWALFSVILVSVVIGGIYYSDALSAVGEQPPQHIFLITVESLRADHVGQCYGYGRKTAPALCGLADDGVLFENAFSQGSHTYSSIPQLLTGLPPNSVASRSFEETGLTSQYHTVFERLHESYGTWAFLQENSAIKKMNVVAGVDELGTIDNMLDTRLGLKRKSFVPEDANRSFTWIFIKNQTHAPYTPPVKYRRWGNVTLSQDSIADMNMNASKNDNLSRRDIIDLYDGEINELDSRLESIFDHLKQIGNYDRSLIVVTADHGQFLGEEGRYMHSGNPKLETVAVPLIIKFPGNSLAGRTVTDPVRHVDIVPTLMDLAGNGTGQGLVGETVLRFLPETMFESFVSSRQRDQRMPYAASSQFKDWAAFMDDGVYRIHDIRRCNRTRSNPPIGKIEGNITDEERSRARRYLCNLYSTGKRYSSGTENVSYNQGERNRLKDLGYLD